MLAMTRSLYLTALLFAFIWPRYVFIGLAGKGVSPYVLLVTMAFAAACLMPLISPRVFSQVFMGMRQAPLVMAVLVIYTVIRFAADVNGVSPGDSLMVTVFYLLTCMSWAMIGITCLIDPGVRARFPVVIMIGGLLATLGGLAEFITQQPFVIISGLDKILADKGNVITAINAASSDADAFRIKGVFQHPIIYGQVMCLMAPLALHMIRFSRGMKRLGGMVLLCGVGFGVYACQSRSPLVVLAISMLTYLALYLFDLRSTLRMISFAVLMAVLAAFAGVASQAVSSSVSGTNAREIKSTEGRQKQFLRASSVMPDRPILGYGSGQSAAYAGIEGRNNVISVDSTIIVEEVDGGYARLAAYFAIFIATMLSGMSLTVREGVLERRSLNAVMTSWVPAINVGLLIIVSDDLMSYAYMAAGFIISGHALSTIENYSRRREPNIVLPA